MHARKSRKEWSRIIRAFGRSGQSHEEFCAEHQLVLGTFRTWLYRLRAAAPTEVALVPVEVTSPVITSEASAIVIEVAGVEVRVTVGADVGYVVGLVSELRARC